MLVVTFFELMCEQKILIATPNRTLRERIKDTLEEKGYTVKTSNNGMDAYACAKFFNPDLVIVEKDLPIRNGIELSNLIIQTSICSVIMISSSNELFDKCMAFEVGIDDYIVVPFEQTELLYRVKAVLRRKELQPLVITQNTLHFDKLDIIFQGYQVKVDGELKSFSPKEFELLFLLASNINTLYTRNEILEKIWNDAAKCGTRTVDIHIQRLREKLNGVSDQWKISTVWGKGYKFELFA